MMDIYVRSGKWLVLGLLFSLFYHFSQEAFSHFSSIGPLFSSMYFVLKKLFSGSTIGRRPFYVCFVLVSCMRCDAMRQHKGKRFSHGFFLESWWGWGLWLPLPLQRQCHVWSTWILCSGTLAWYSFNWRILSTKPALGDLFFYASTRKERAVPNAATV
jgi:hypothetical protein